MATSSATGQGSSEYLILLGVVLIVGLGVVGLLMFYPGTAGDMKQTQSDLYWQTAKPIAIKEVEGSIGESLEGHHTDAVIFVLKNTDVDKITIKGISVAGYRNILTDGSIGVNGYGNPTVSGNDCSALQNNASNCSIAVYPGKTVNVMALSGIGILCNAAGGGLTAGSLNSVRPNAEAEIRIYYEKRGLINVETSQVKLAFQCSNYWKCSAHAECVATYGGAYCIPESGGCIEGEVPP